MSSSAQAHVAACRLKPILNLPPPAFLQLPPEIADQLNPFDSYLGPYLEQIQAEKSEQYKLTNGPAHTETPGQQKLTK